MAKGSIKECSEHAGRETKDHWVKTCCVCWPWRFLHDRLINWTYITATFLSLVSSSPSVRGEDDLLSKGIFNSNIYEITQCVASECLLAKTCEAEKKEKKR